MSAPCFPVSIKGVMTIGGRIPLLLNERQEWELPGGRLESGEQPEQALVRELHEELNIEIRVERILDCWLYAIPGHGEVVIVTYACAVLRSDDLRRSLEHKDLLLARSEELANLTLPKGYRRSIKAFLAI
jgi:8-oxo-dGTP pyrophosphatase MutT (NUDIX family)